MKFALIFALIAAVLCCLGVEFGARMITIDSKQIKLQIWDTVSHIFDQIFHFFSLAVVLYLSSKQPNYFCKLAMNPYGQGKCFKCHVKNGNLK